MNKMLLYTTWDYWKSWNETGHAIPAWTEDHASEFEILVEFDWSSIGEMTDNGMFIISKKKPEMFSKIYLYTKWELLCLWQHGQILELDLWTKDHVTKFEVMSSFTFDEIHEHTYGGMFIAKRKENPYYYPIVKEV
jgi:hypothetical protein